MQTMKPKPGFVVEVSSLPKCDFCEREARYDFRTRMGPWAHGCDEHWTLYGTGRLGVGSGQMLITHEEVEVDS